MGYNASMNDEAKQENESTETGDEAVVAYVDDSQKESAIEESPLERAERERDENMAGWQRAQADMQNLKKQHAEQLAALSEMAKAGVIIDLLPVLDNFEAAFSNKEAWESVDENWRVGVEYIYQQFIQTLENQGAQQFGQVGDAFDAASHEPIETVAVEDGAQKNTIVEVVQPGYKIGERIIRPVKVKVGE